MSTRGRAWHAGAWMTALALPTMLPAQPAPRADIAIDDTRVHPESITSTRDGAVYIGSFGKGAVYRAAPGASVAETWLPAGVAGPALLGVLADDRRGLLWVCVPSREAVPSAIKAFDLRTGAERASYGFEGGGRCNDMAVARDGTVYASDFEQGRLMRLKKGDTLFRPWALNPGFKTADGVAVLADGQVYLNTFRENGLWRIPVLRGGAAGTPVQIQTDRPLVRPDGMRPADRGRALLLVEGEGRLVEVRPQGDRATVRVLREGIPDSAAGVTLVGDTAFLVQAKFALLRDPAKDPGPFSALAIPYAPSR